MCEHSPFGLEVMELGPMENFIYLIHDHATQRAAVVDPAWEVPEILQWAEKKAVKITDILLTHSHHDHINGIQGVRERYDAQVHLLKAEADFWGQYQDTTHHGGDIIQLGQTAIEILHTPGHTPGSACYKLGDHLIAGDTLFVFGCGRCDLAGGDPHEMFNTLKKIKTDLPAHTILHPGHNYAEKTTSTLEEQAEGNPFMHFDQVEDFVHYRMHEHDKVRHSPYGPVLKA
ncbi:MAG: MBL fold metallo-hydrolase [Gammaproteobacteria bacterium]|nr:MBL fold metallo-hydrolase [Gammaproteobacteria bacterium]MDH5802860.1 MBL fold metallo-hydrolase [Gammaproteobacteria bacterium]